MCDPGTNYWCSTKWTLEVNISQILGQIFLLSLQFTLISLLNKTHDPLFGTYSRNSQLNSQLKAQLKAQLDVKAQMVLKAHMVHMVVKAQLVMNTITQLFVKESYFVTERFPAHAQGPSF